MNGFTQLIIISALFTSHVQSILLNIHEQQVIRCYNAELSIDKVNAPQCRLSMLDWASSEPKKTLASYDFQWPSKTQTTILYNCYTTKLKDASNREGNKPIHSNTLSITAKIYSKRQIPINSVLK